MPASPLTRSVGVRTSAAALTTVALAGAALLGAPAAHAAPDSGDVKIHSETTSPTDQRDETKVCKFYLAAFNFEGVGVTGITYIIEPQPAASAAATLNGTLNLPIGTGYTDTLALPDGNYKLTWKPVGGAGAGKEKLFKVDCKPAAKPDAKPQAPKGAVPAGGGGLAETPTVSTVAAAGAVGLVGVSGFVYFRQLRRRSDGAA
ncbi:hypothetical protein C6Y14_04395 [Streptomyces dioscori]|uniref:LPXTG cell wall anchor domain-containing protein n=1 Tax=Streptomyces dioscori TaxID=2109333 RepID=A0A2P8QGD5_9ACTN|nr:hypothetical protein [Streptomyces dioscori]PSM45300.1 hypothetical protein C6Y14_04395 [Streptomyces dioscori]